MAIKRKFNWDKINDNIKQQEAKKSYSSDDENSLYKIKVKEDGTYELIGEKVQGNPEKIEGHHLIKHGAKVLQGLVNPMTFENLKEYLEKVDIEGIVFHHKSDGRMCKLRKSDFGIRR